MATGMTTDEASNPTSMPAKDKKPVVKRPPKTMKERKFVKAYLETGVATTAVKLAGYNVKDDNSASTIAVENLRKLTMDHWFQEAGLTNEVMAQNTTQIALLAEKMDAYTGERTPDYTARLNAMKFAAQLTGLVKAGDINISNTQNNVTVTPILSGLTQDESKEGQA